MGRLKVFFVMGLVVSMLILCAFAPGICIDRLVVPDSCRTGCIASSTSCCNDCIVIDSHDEVQ